MRVVIQRVSSASVTVDEQVIGEIGHGLLILLGAREGDTVDDLEYLADKTANLRIFEDSDAKMNLSLLDLIAEGGTKKYGALVVSQFTLYADTRKGRRPSFTQALEPVSAERLYEKFVEKLRSMGITVATGSFGAKMNVSLLNSGPVTIIIDSEQRLQPR